MFFRNPKPGLTENDIRLVEVRIGLTLPKPLRGQYLIANGGCPEPYVYEDDIVDTVVNAFLPLCGLPGSDSAEEAYKDLVLGKQIVPAHYFPFAVDGGGDYFFVNCESARGEVFFFRSDSDEDDPTQRLVNLRVDVDEFWSRLKPE